METGIGLVNSVWTAVGAVVVFAAVLMIIVKNFIGGDKNIPRGIGLIVAVAVVAVLASNPQAVMNIGESVLEIFGVSKS